MSQGQFSAIVRHLRQVAGTQRVAEISDADLLTRFSTTHDEAAFELLLWRHGAMVLRLCRDVTRDDHTAEDAFQAVFFALACKAGSIRKRQSLGAWLHRTAYRVALRARCRTRATGMRVDPTHDLSTLEASSHAGDELMLRELRSLLHEEVARLPAKYRCPIILCYLEGLAYEDAAQRLGWPKGTLAGRVARARNMLRKRLLRRGVALPVALAALTNTTNPASALPLVSLIKATLRGGLNMAAGAAAPGIDSSHAAALTRGVLQEMCWSNLKMMGALVLSLSLVGSGIGLLASTRPDERIDSITEQVAEPRENQTEKFEAAGKFELGIQHISCLALSPDGKRFAAGGNTMESGMPRGVIQLGRLLSRLFPKGGAWPEYYMSCFFPRRKGSCHRRI